MNLLRTETGAIVNLDAVGHIYRMDAGVVANAAGANVRLANCETGSEAQDILKALWTRLAWAGVGVDTRIEMADIRASLKAGNADLLEALETLLRVINEGEPTQIEMMSALNKARIQAHRAIAEARGEAVAS